MAIKKEILQKRLGERIAYLRTTKGLNQTELAHYCNKDRQSINRLEKGKVNPSIYYLLQISNALEINMSELFNFDLK
ncbi:helix-turn-helix domain-containing protein [Fulvivirga maritima]|uniref:helix-turn-helix domain-containing protein n=1 Tax=Fulvivirga maritima TaxID=2904247 RepID=UPI001F22AEB1|nr:helix-turn-helix transcriptional regulator [Fulvivirga maritima]UII27619.1 helix-turn-helix domain-containing protein [Fulvivirga maritima]